MKVDKGFLVFLLRLFSAVSIVMGGMIFGCGDGDGVTDDADITGNAQAIKITEVMFIPSDGPEWVELYNTSSDENANISQMEIRNAKGDAYRVPRDTPYRTSRRICTYPV